MIQLKNNSMVWKAYCRYWDSDPNENNPGRRAPHPKSVCTLCRQALFGAVLWFSVDLMLAIALPVMLIINGLLTWWALSEKDSDTYGSIAVLVFCGLSWFLFVGAGMSRFIDFVSAHKNGHKITVITLIVLAYSSLSFFFSLMWRDVYDSGGLYGIIYLVHGFFTTMLLCLVVCAFFYSLFKVWCWYTGDTTSAHVVKSALKAIKSRVCPMVKAPWEETASTINEPIATNQGGKDAVRETSRDQQS